MLRVSLRVTLQATAGLQAVKGMNDLLPTDSAKWAWFEALARATFERHGYREIATPLVEYTPLFVRSIGEVTDIVEKEMYTFNDRDERSITLRPEGTASTVRAYLEHSVHKKEPVSKWFYSGPMFRHERAQKGRYRQFYQMGVEAYGVTEPTAEAEQVAMLVALFTEVGITGLDAVVNNVGGPEDRPAYIAALRAYFEPHRAELCEDCRRRLDKNPLRILDCKVEGCRKLTAGAPSLLDHLGAASRAHFDAFLASLTALGVPYRVDPRLVRGLDYYTGTTFEIRSSSGELGSQNTLGAGGRYDRLVEDLGGPATSAVGFALGVERAILTIPGAPEDFEPRVDVYLAAMGEAARRYCLVTAQKLRAHGLRAEIEHRAASLKAQLKRADRVRARTVVVIGEEELAAKEVMLRDMTAGSQRSVGDADLVEAIKAQLAAAPVASAGSPSSSSR